LAWDARTADKKREDELKEKRAIEKKAEEKEAVETRLAEAVKEEKERVARLVEHVASAISFVVKTCLPAGAEQEGLAHNPCSTHPPHPVVESRFRRDPRATLRAWACRLSRRDTREGRRPRRQGRRERAGESCCYESCCVQSYGSNAFPKSTTRDRISSNGKGGRRLRGMPAPSNSIRPSTVSRPKSVFHSASFSTT